MYCLFNLTTPGSSKERYALCHSDRRGLGEEFQIKYFKEYIREESDDFLLPFAFFDEAGRYIGYKLYYGSTYGYTTPQYTST